MGEYVVRVVGVTELAAAVEPLAWLYRLSFVGPPWNEREERFAAFAEVFAAHLAHEGVRGVLVWSGDEIVGAAYGWRAAPEIPDAPAFYQAVRGAVDSADHRGLRAPAFEVVNFMVDPGHQRRGLGRRMLSCLVDDADGAWLCTHPEAPARALYESAGFVVRGAITLEDVPLVVMTLDRRL
ncbi:GNAT family N-acetyltransferase [Actinokineospora auranticolor]|nr:GNAT family N-acetyltransferase [Actinokineospora auranticolor]